MLASHLATIRLVHIACAALSGCLFGVRGLLRLAAIRIVNHWLLRITSYVIDTTLFRRQAGPSHSSVRC